MSDLEITRLCAEAMGLTVHPQLHRPEVLELHHANGSSTVYEPLLNDAQAFALLKAFNLAIGRLQDMVRVRFSKRVKSAWLPRSQLNRAAVQCVAYMRKGGVA